MSEMSKALYLKGTDEPPAVTLDPKKNLFSIEGRCIPEDGVEFFMPIMEWLRQYGIRPNPNTIVDINLSYFNSASSKAMWEFFSLLRKVESNIKIKWHYSDDDDEMRDAGEEFASFFSLPFDYIAHQEEEVDDDFPF